MARLEYHIGHEPGADEADVAVERRIRERRGGRLVALDRMLLHSPPLADGWNSLLGAVRGSAVLRGDVRELAILRVAALNGADYEWNAHEPIGRREGLADADIAALRADGSPEALTGAYRAARDYTDAMTRDVRVAPAVFDALREHLTDREIVELTLTVGSYNMVSRFLVALEVGPDGDETAG